MAFKNEIFDHLLNNWREKIALKCSYTTRRLGWDEVDTDDPAIRSRPFHGNLDLSIRLFTSMALSLTCDQLPGAYPLRE
jgi:hypothetical protein